MTDRMHLLRLTFAIVNDSTEYVAAFSAQHVQGVPEVDRRATVGNVPQLTDDLTPSHFIKRLAAKLKFIG